MTGPKREETLIGSIVFLDIVDFSLQIVSKQFEWKGALNKIISVALQEFQHTEVILLDTGDGSALCFLGDPEVALDAAMWIQGTVLELYQTMSPPMRLRVGINLGAIKILQDLNNHKNIVGDGINVAQRVMSFAEPGQILASRSFFDVVSCLKREYQLLFGFKGIRKDKHVREHEVYEVKIQEISAPDGESIVTKSAESVSLPAQLGEIFSSETLLALETTACAYLGPVAKIILRKASPSRTIIEDLCSTLATQLADPKEKQNFTKEYRRILHVQPAPNYTPSITQDIKELILPEDEILSLIQILAVYMGPIAKLMVRKELKRASSREALHLNLAHKIGDEVDHGKFLKQLQLKQ